MLQQWPSCGICAWIWTVNSLRSDRPNCPVPRVLQYPTAIECHCSATYWPETPVEIGVLDCMTLWARENGHCDERPLTVSGRFDAAASIREGKSLWSNLRTYCCRNLGCPRAWWRARTLAGERVDSPLGLRDCTLEATAAAHTARGSAGWVGFSSMAMTLMRPSGSM
jgi:hypothetical protein